jgi:signal transduction histidine kinase
VKLRLTTLLLLAFLLLGTLLAVGYSILSAQYLIRGMDMVMGRDMEQTLISFLAEGHDQSGLYRDFYFARQWQDLPVEVRHAFDTLPETQGVLLKAHDGVIGMAPQRIHFLLRYPLPENEWLISRTLEKPDGNRLMDNEVDNNRRLINLVGLGSLLVLALVAFMLQRWVARPVTRLLDWTRQLQPQQLSEPTPDFGYPDINELGNTIRTSLASVHDSLEREQAFLRHTSHELRTPISVVRSNVDLLNKLSGREGEAAAQLRSAALARLQRAGQTMTHLTETLLWLSRDHLEDLPAHELDLAALLQQLVDDMSYLLNRKTVVLQLNTSPHCICLAETAARIVLGNLIRNAFQHTWEGEVMIVQQGGEVTISNYNHEAVIDSTAAEQRHDDLGFGLGLQLTERLTRRLGWPYVNEAGALGHTARVILVPTLSRP